MFKNIHRIVRLKHMLVVFSVIAFLSCAYIICAPISTYTIGNIFFGGVDSLYNVKLAQWFYTRSAYPLFPKLTPRYAHYQLSRTYFIQGELHKALEEAQKELVLYPDNTKTYYILGLTRGYMHQTHEAIDDFSRYIEANPGTWAGRNDKAWLQFRIGDIDGALATIEPVVTSFPKTPWVQNTYCALLLNKPDRLEEALQVCTSAKMIIDEMTPLDWGHSYPGNDPQVYEIGLKAMQRSIKHNLDLVNEKLDAKYSLVGG